MRILSPIVLAALLACGAVVNASADPLGSSSSHSSELWTGPNTIDPGSRFQLNTIQPGPSRAPDGPLSAPASQGVSGPLSSTPGPGLQPEPRRGTDLDRLTPGKPSIYINKPDIYGCGALGALHPGQQTGLNARYCGYGGR